MIDPGTVERIHDTAEIADVVQDFVTLKRRGVNYIGLCPFHNEKTPSFIVSPAKGIFKCFGCGKGGNSVNFIMEHEQLSYVEALRYLAKKYHIEIHEQEETQEQIEQRNERESMMIVSAYAQKYFTKILHNDDQGRNVGLAYFRQRGIRDDIIKKFELGYCLDSKSGFTDAAMQQGYQLEFLEKTGLTIKRDNWIRDRFAARVIFPIHNIAGRVIAFGGRTLKSDKKIAKYLNSPESEIYHKSNILYGMFQAKREITKKELCYLVEGYTDVLAFHQAGIENVVASSGTSLTSNQIRLIKRFTDNITIIYDGDDAGIKASIRGIDLILEQGLNVKVLLLPQGEDPDSFARSMSATELTTYIEQNKVDFINFKTNLLLKNTDNDPVTRAKVISEIVRSISMIPEPIVRSVYIKECSSLLDVKEEILYQEIRKIKQKESEDLQNKQARQQRIQEQEAPTTPLISQGKDLKCQAEEREIIRILLKFKNYKLFEETLEDNTVEIVTVGDFIVNEIEAEEWTLFNPVYQTILEESTNLPSDTDFNCQRHFTIHQNEQVSRVTSDILAEKYTESNRWKNNGSYVESEEDVLGSLVPKIVIEYKMARVKLLEKQILEQMNTINFNEDPESFMQLQQQMMNLKKVEKVLSENLGKRAITG
ncbi:DNA primase [Puteibacter caeruleilacunae]|nr:DNA primase [Puteibacter caeruleilacunae]